LCSVRLRGRGNGLPGIVSARELESFHAGFCGLAFCRTL
jgi:hypothetical protein